MDNKRPSIAPLRRESTRILSATYLFTPHPQFNSTLNRSVFPGSSLFGNTGSVERNLECDLTYCEYIQALMKKQITKKCIQEQEEDVTTQLALRRDKLYRNKLELRKIKEKIVQLETFSEIDQLLQCLRENVIKFSHLITTESADDILEQVLPLLRCVCKKILISDFECSSIMKSKEDFEEFRLLLENCVKLTEKFGVQRRNEQEIKDLSATMSLFKEKAKTLSDKQESLEHAQETELRNLLQSMSDWYLLKK